MNLNVIKVWLRVSGVRETVEILWGFSEGFGANDYYVGFLTFRRLVCMHE